MVAPDLSFSDTLFRNRRISIRDRAERLRRQLSNLSRTANSLHVQLNPYGPSSHDISSAQFRRPISGIIGGHAHPLSLSSVTGSTTTFLRRRHSLRENRSMKRHFDIHSTSGESPLPFTIVYTDGGEYTSEYSVQNMLANDSSVYCSVKQENVNTLLRFNDPSRRWLKEPSFVLTKVLVKAPSHGFTSPLRSGAIFVAMEPISFADTKAFDNMTRSEWEEFSQIAFDDKFRKINNIPESSSFKGRIRDMLRSRSYPCCFFELNSIDASHVVEIFPPRTGKYVLIKLISSSFIHQYFPVESNISLSQPSRDNEDDNTSTIVADYDHDDSVDSDGDNEGDNNNETFGLDDEETEPNLHPWIRPWVDEIAASEVGISPTSSGPISRSYRRHIAREASRLIPEAYARSTLHSPRNIDVQHVGLYGYTGPRSFAEYLVN